MRQPRLTMLELALIGATRGMLGAGLGLLLAGRIPRDRRVVVGTVLVAVGALSTIPLAIRVFRSRPALENNGHARLDPTQRPFAG